ncbi:MAG: hypothetical protein ABSH28_03810 [Acidobacteriota bacterium]
MLSINLVPLLGGSLLVSATLIIVSKRRVGVAGSAAAIIALCLVLAFVEFRDLSTGAAVRQAVQYWLIFLCVPSAVVFALSRSGLLRRRAWLLLLAGPISFVLTIVVVVSVLHMFFPSVLSP